MTREPPGAFGSLDQTSVASTDLFPARKKKPSGTRPGGARPAWLHATRYLVGAWLLAFALQSGIAFAAILHAPDQAPSIVEANGKAFASLFGALDLVIASFRNR